LPVGTQGGAIVRFRQVLNGLAWYETNSIEVAPGGKIKRVQVTLLDPREFAFQPLRLDENEAVRVAIAALHSKHPGAEVEEYLFADR
jgi:hypothetical protein